MASKARVRGGNNLKHMLNAAKYGGVRGVRVGFFATAKYPDGTPVTSVAAKNEFGIGVPERPFMRRANDVLKGEIGDYLKTAIDPKTMRVTEIIAGQIGLKAEFAVQKSITDLRSPPNAPSTVRRKRSSNPLIHTEKMRESVDSEVIK